VTEDHPLTNAPALVRYSNPIANRLFRLGLPTGPNVLMTVRGRASGLPRTAPVAIVELEGRRWIIGAYGEVQWVRNLRAAREAEIRIHGRLEHVTAAALNRPAAKAFYRDTLPAYLARLPWLGRVLGRLLLRLIAPDLLADPERAAANRPVFELLASS
jgi:deazaflavin-dependent oxidoreductase (nitroreductase family)